MTVTNSFVSRAHVPWYGGEHSTSRKRDIYIYQLLDEAVAVVELFMLPKASIDGKCDCTDRHLGEIDSNTAIEQAYFSHCRSE